jgi:hypothetical protein
MSIYRISEDYASDIIEYIDDAISPYTNADDIYIEIKKINKDIQKLEYIIEYEIYSVSKMISMINSDVETWNCRLTKLYMINGHNIYFSLNNIQTYFNKNVIILILSVQIKS